VVVGYRLNDESRPRVADYLLPNDPFRSCFGGLPNCPGGLYDPFGDDYLVG